MAADAKNTKVFVSILPPNWHKPRSPYALYDELCTGLRKILGETDANRIIAEVEPQANTYTLPVAVLRMYTVLEVAAAGCTATMLLEIVKNHQEEAALMVIRAGHAGAFDLRRERNVRLEEFDRPAL